MWKTCVTLALLICVQVCAHGPLYPRILGGVDAQRRAWPWIVSLHDPTCHFCGGSLISHQWVLSAAHCFWDDEDGTIMNETTIRVYLGKMTQSGVNKNEIVRFVHRIYIHDLYNATTDINDIALLYLSSPVKFNNYISPLCLVAHGSDFPNGTSSRIIGWGQTAHKVNLPYPGTLQEAEVILVDNTECQIQLNQWNCRVQITPNMICAGIPVGGIGVYHGDSGGPMMSQYCSKWVQSGIVSWGIGCGLPNAPGVYTRVSQYQQWITNTIQNHPSPDLPQFVNVNLPCPPDTGTWSHILRWCCCLRGEE